MNKIIMWLMDKGYEYDEGEHKDISKNCKVVDWSSDDGSYIEQGMKLKKFQESIWDDKDDDSDYFIISPNISVVYTGYADVFFLDGELKKDRLGIFSK